MKLSRFFNYRESFSARIFWVFSIMTIVVTISFATFFYRHQSVSLTDKLVGKGELLATLLAHNARLGVFTENADLLTAPASGIMENPDTLSIAIYTVDGKALLKENRQGEKTAPENERWDKEITASLKHSNHGQLTGNKGDLIFWSAVVLKPIITEKDAVYFDSDNAVNTEQTIGFVRVIMDGRNLHKALQTLLLESILIGLFFLIIGAMIAFLVSEGITRHLNRLTLGVKNFSAGHEYNEIAVRSDDEIGKLASAFNEMVTSLKKREEEKAELEDKLRHSQKMEAIGTLAGGVAHDFNNILMAINGYSALLQLELAEGSKLWSYAEQIIRAGERAANLTQRLLAFTRKQIISPRPVLLDDIIGNIEKLLTRLITEDVEIEIRLEAGDAVVMADAGQIDQVLINLVTNARDALPHGGKICIATSVTILDEDFVLLHDQPVAGRYVKIMVSDNGIGIPDDVRERMFDPFFTTKEVGKGTGLGLSMVYGIVKQHNGIIEVDSGPGQGTAFSIYLPLLELVLKEQQSSAAAFQRGRNETILVAEDDETVMRFMKGLLESNGYNVIAVINGEEAVREFGKFSDIIDLVILDVIMPRKNGKEVYEEISRIRPGIKAIFVSGYTSDVIDWKCALEEDLTLIPKPVQPATLLSKIREALERQTEERETEN